MSTAAVVWALHKAPTRTPSQRLVLTHLAERADSEGRGAFPAVETIRLHLGMSERTVRQHLADLEADKLISRGDQNLSSYLRADQRPIVWDLDLTALRTDIPEDVRDSPSRKRGRSGRARKFSGVQPTAPRPPRRGAANRTPSESDGVQPTAPRSPNETPERGAAQRANGVQPAAPEPSTEPTTKNSLPTVVSSPRARDNKPATTNAAKNATSVGNELLTEHLAACPVAPPRRVTQRTGLAIDDLVREGIPAERIRAGLTLLRSRPRCGPSLLPEFVHEAAVAATQPTWGRRGRENAHDVLDRVQARLDAARDTPLPADRHLKIVEGEIA